MCAEIDRKNGVMWKHSGTEWALHRTQLVTGWGEHCTELTPKNLHLSTSCAGRLPHLAREVRSACQSCPTNFASLESPLERFSLRSAEDSSRFDRGLDPHLANCFPPVAPFTWT